MDQSIYLDYNATTPVEESVVDRMVPFFTTNFGNPSSKGHSYGWYADAAVENAREQVASLLNAGPSEITFTSGATEAINTIIKGVAAKAAGNRLITTRTEHKAVLQTCACLEREGVEVVYLPVNSLGLISLDDLKESLNDDTFLVVLMWANNETGVINPISDISSITREAGVPLFSDATQAVGKIEVDATLVDYLACSAHKFYGPKGAGAMYCSSTCSAEPDPLITGGGQEEGRRSGTLNVPAIVGMGEAAAVAEKRRVDDYNRWLTLREKFEKRLVECDGVVVNAGAAERLPQTANVAFPNVSAIKLSLRLRELAFSAGSACQSGAGEPSHVLTAMGIAPDVAGKSMRFSFGRKTTEADIDKACDIICNAYDELVAANSATV